jgi:hypothetical protein
LKLRPSSRYVDILVVFGQEKNIICSSELRHILELSCSLRERELQTEKRTMRALLLILNVADMCKITHYLNESYKSYLRALRDLEIFEGAQSPLRHPISSVLSCLF